MKYLDGAKTYMLAAAVICVCVRIIFAAIEPLLPYLLGGLILLGIFSTIFGIMWNRSSKL